MGTDRTRSDAEMLSARYTAGKRDFTAYDLASVSLVGRLSTVPYLEGRT